MSEQENNLASAPRGADLASDFTSSLKYDKRLYREELAVSTAHAKMLAKQGIIDSGVAQALQDALEQIRNEIESGKFKWNETLEDIHMNVEARLYEILGKDAGHLHTARSRNDLIATDTRLYVKRACDEAIDLARQLQRDLVNKAQSYVDTVMPAYTHLQRGQPVLLAHHLLAYYEMLKRDITSFEHAYSTADWMPLGSGAATGTPYPLDREFVAKELGFKNISTNSMDAVSDRDYIVWYICAASTCMTHLSRLAEELVVWASNEFDFAKLPEDCSTGSSIMPQKRNPDFAELIRGKTGRAYGALINILTTIKGTPLTYNRDLQEDKVALFDAVDTIVPSLQAMSSIFAGIEFNSDRMTAAVNDNVVLATDVADYLARKGVPFREAYVIARQVSKLAVERDTAINELDLTTLRQFSPLFEADMADLTVANSLRSRAVLGGTAPDNVKAQLKQAQTELANPRPQNQ